MRAYGIVYYFRTYLAKECFIHENRDNPKIVYPRIAGTVEFNESVDQRFPLFIIRKQLYLEGFKHNIDTTIQRIMVSQFLPHLKKWASLRLEIVIHVQGGSYIIHAHENCRSSGLSQIFVLPDITKASATSAVHLRNRCNSLEGYE